MADSPRPSSATERPHVLTASDDVDLQQFLAEGLTYGGFWTSAVASAIQTLEVFRLRGFDLVLVDAALSGLAGVELVRRLRGRSARGDEAPRTDVPIFLLSGGSGEVDQAAARAAGADGVLTAPLELENLVLLLHEAVAAWRADHPGVPTADALAARPRSGE